MAVRLSLLLLAFSSLVAGCAADVATDYDASVNFSRFNSYQYQEDPNVPVSLDGARIKRAVDYQMAGKGFKKVDSNSDLLVRYSILEGSELRSDGLTVGFGIGTSTSGRGGYGVSARTPERFKEKKFGKLNVELIEAKSNEVVWRSISQRQLTETMDSDDRDAFIMDQVGKMFEQYPR
ncbi:DUF4136 domain-containing protein [Vibrio sp. ZSDZ34]|jgi:hypothetical protein|uniref:DUF4136 domain-containing protein n=1 Tax=Vibrio gelatinilyticus TaxID=2893468 RepID=A0A9X2B0M5_9VIBR|nr:DUF4136 domain-containing protein [Vibrio gelatinilyticus]MCJ2378763.1 DUF4136 domain-containing protein [Vibrio gelatinilyticus]